MSGKMDKKTRQLYRKEFSKNLSKFEFDVIKMLKPAPRWFPGRIWHWLQGKFLNI